MLVSLSLPVRGSSPIPAESRKSKIENRSLELFRTTQPFSLLALRPSLSRSVTGEFADLAASDIVTPVAKIEVHEGSELAGTPHLNHQLRATPRAPSEAAAARPAAAVEPKTAAMSQKREDVLTAKHSERVLVVGKGVVLTANVTSCDKVVVEGQFQGNIKTGTFVLSEGAFRPYVERGTKRPRFQPSAEVWRPMPTAQLF